MNYFIKITLLLVSISFGCAQEIGKITSELPWSNRIADSFISRHPDFATHDSLHPNQKWNYEQGLILFALYQTYLQNKNEKYLKFVAGNLDKYINENGEIKTYNLEEYNIDNILPGRTVLELYHLTRQEKYKIAADKLREQLKTHPRTNEGGFWHKKIYPYQMWLDGIYMAQPFSARYAQLFNEQEMFDDIANQFLFIANHTYDKKTGLYYHGWDESRQQKWANPETGCSPNFWSRSMGWYLMALVDVLDYFPDTHPKRSELIKIFSQLSESILKYRDQKSGLWYQVTDQIGREGNYLEASSSCMFGYSFAKGATKGYLDKRFFNVAEDVFNCVIREFVKVDNNGFVDLYGTCKSAGLGGKPYRDGSYEYYMSEPTRVNDMKGIGAIILFALELEKYKK
ncbi:MAG: unsaturated glucuronyl hydrolase, GH88 family [Ignavibacteriae bacterium]|nr:MAG: unsaturated glucuronyl hydrolase, GH88 family [Ignavibacteriota bacterium]